jgi:pimeloyl-ACP methyl ester carboxylesterase
VLNLSPGLDEIAAKLQRQGINATVHNHLAWPLLADEAAADYKSGRATAIVLVGHSAGAAAVTSMGARLGALGVPVRLAIGMDPVWPTTASGHIGRYVNYYSDGAGMAVDKSPQFRGSFQNVDLKNMPSIGHFNIDTDARMQTKVIASIRAALYGDRHAALKPEIAASPGSTAAAAAR